MYFFSRIFIPSEKFSKFGIGSFSIIIFFLILFLFYPSNILLFFKFFYDYNSVVHYEFSKIPDPIISIFFKKTRLFVVLKKKTDPIDFKKNIF